MYIYCFANLGKVSAAEYSQGTRERIILRSLPRAFIPETQNPQKTSPHPDSPPRILRAEPGPSREQGWKLVVASLGSQSQVSSRTEGLGGAGAMYPPGQRDLLFCTCLVLQVLFSSLAANALFFLGAESLWRCWRAMFSSLASAQRGEGRFPWADIGRQISVHRVLAGGVSGTHRV